MAAGLVEGGKLTAVTVGGVGAQAHVAGHQEAGEVLAQQTDGLDSRGVLGVCRRAPLILGTGEGQSGRTKSHEAFGRHSGQPPGHSPSPLLYHHDRPWTRRHGEDRSHFAEGNLTCPFRAAALLSFPILHGCCFKGRGCVRSPVAPGPAQGWSEGVVSVEPQLILTQPPPPLPSDPSSDLSPWELCWGRRRLGHSAGPPPPGASASLPAGSHHTCMEGLK